MCVSFHNISKCPVITLATLVGKKPIFSVEFIYFMLINLFCVSISCSFIVYNILLMQNMNNKWIISNLILKLNLCPPVTLVYLNKNHDLYLHFGKAYLLNVNKKHFFGVILPYNRQFLMKVYNKDVIVSYLSVLHNISKCPSITLIGQNVLL